MLKEAIPWIHVPAALYGNRKHLWQEGRVFRKIKIQRLGELTAKSGSAFNNEDGGELHA